MTRLVSVSIVLALLLAGAKRIEAGDDGQELVGTRVPDWTGEIEWLNRAKLPPQRSFAGKVVLLRFFLHGNCPLCRATLPTLQELHKDFEQRGLVVVGVHTPKPPGSVDRAALSALVDKVGLDFPIGIDANWTVLRRVWLDPAENVRYTSSSLLIDTAGVIRFVHPGGVFARTAPEGSRARRDYVKIREAIEDVLEGR